VLAEQTSAIRFALEREQSRALGLQESLDRCSSDSDAQRRKLSEAEGLASEMQNQLAACRSNEAAALERRYALETLVAEKDRKFSEMSNELQARLDESNTALKQATKEHERLARRLESKSATNLQAEVEEARRMLADQRRDLASKEEELVSAARSSKEHVATERAKVLRLEQELAQLKRHLEHELTEGKQRLESQKQTHAQEVQRLTFELQRVRSTPLVAQAGANAGGPTNAATLAASKQFVNENPEAAPIVDLSAMQDIADRALSLGSFLEKTVPPQGRGALPKLVAALGSSAVRMIAVGSSATSVEQFCGLARCLLALAEELGFAIAGTGVGLTSNAMDRTRLDSSRSFRPWDPEFPSQTVDSMCQMLASGILAIGAALNDSRAQWDTKMPTDFKGVDLERALLVAKHEREQWTTRLAWCQPLNENDAAKQLYSAGSVALQIINAQTASLARAIREVGHEAGASEADRQTGGSNEAFCLSELRRLDLELARVEESESAGSGLDGLELQVARSVESEQRARHRESLRDMTSRVVQRTLVVLLLLKQRVEDLATRISWMRDSMGSVASPTRSNAMSLERVQRLYLEGSVERMQHELAKATARADALQHELCAHGQQPLCSPERHATEAPGVIDNPGYAGADVRSLQGQIAGQRLRIPQHASQIDVRLKTAITWDGVGFRG
jgi:hypothetical protein